MPKRGPSLQRRDLLTRTAWLGAGLAGLPLVGVRASNWRHGIYLVPGYRTDVAAYRGRPVAESEALRLAFPAYYEGRGTLVTQIDERDGSVRRALLPILGHAISVAPRGDLAVWNSMNGDSLVSFDPASLDLVGFARPRGEAFIGGGHAAFTADGRHVLFTERKRYGEPPARAEDQFGQITIRDPQSLDVLERYDCHGISPHQVELLADGQHIAVSNYGSVNQPGPGERLQIVEPSVTLLELSSGRLVEKWVGPDLRYEVRHLAVGGRERIAAILVREVESAEAQDLHAGFGDITEPDFSAQSHTAYLPAPVQFYGASGSSSAVTATLPEPPELARQGQSLVYDPRHDEMIVTFASSHTVIVFAAESGSVRNIIRTDRLGLRYPRGIALHPDGEHYAVSGSWRGILLFRRGSHVADAARALHAVFFDHSHLAIA